MKPLLPHIHWLCRLAAACLAAAFLAAAPHASAQGQRGQKPEAKEPKIEQVAYAWRPSLPTGMPEPAEMDTLEYNYFQQAIPSMVSYAYACTGNLGAEGKNMLAMEQAPASHFFLQDAQRHWTPMLDDLKFYNTRIPMTLLSYNTGGGRDNAQDRLQATFSGNINKRAQAGAMLDYLYSKGSYANQAAKGLCWGLNGSYMGDRYEMQASWVHYNLLNKENGGIVDDMYIIDPAKIQGGVSSINPKTIPTNLSAAHTRIKGGELFVNNRYNVGYWHEEREGDSVTSREYVPSTSFFWTLNYKQAMHMFRDENMAEASKFFENTYLNPKLTDDRTSYWSMSNTVGISLLEGFNKWAKFGLAGFVRHEMRRFTQAADTIERADPAEAGLTPFPAGVSGIPGHKNQQLAWAGAQISKQQGSILTYQATGEIGFMGDAAGEVRVSGAIDTRIPLLGDTVQVSGFGYLCNTSAPYLLKEYISNHFVWQNDLGMERRLRLGGRLHIPWTSTTVTVATETLQNLIYFDSQARPAQNSGGVQVFSATLEQNLRAGILHWDNKVTYQTSTDQRAMPLPQVAAYSNLYILCRIATLHLQLGLDCGYYTKYYAPAYQPATATFYNQQEQKLGNYPFATAYANMKLSRVRFYVMMSHVNQGIVGGNNYFSTSHYPLNPRRFQLGLSVDFHD